MQFPSLPHTWVHRALLTLQLLQNGVETTAASVCGGIQVRIVAHKWVFPARFSSKFMFRALGSLKRYMAYHLPNLHSFYTTLSENICTFMSCNVCDQKGHTLKRGKNLTSVGHIILTPTQPVGIGCGDQTHDFLTRCCVLYPLSYRHHKNLLRWPTNLDTTFV